MKELHHVSNDLECMRSEWCKATRMLNLYLAPTGVPCVSPGVLAALETTADRLYNALPDEADEPIDIALKSAVPDVFSLGGDLSVFLRCLRDKEMFDLIDYAGACTRLVTRWYDKLAGKPIRTWAIIDGAALGGGLEIALTCDHILYTPGSYIGFPEYGFGSFPGMGAVPMLSARGGDPLDLAGVRACDVNAARLIGAERYDSVKLQQRNYCPRTRPRVSLWDFTKTTEGWLKTMENLPLMQMNRLGKIRAIQERKYGV